MGSISLVIVFQAAVACSFLTSKAEVKPGKKGTLTSRHSSHFQDITNKTVMELKKHWYCSQLSVEALTDTRTLKKR